MHAIRRSKDDVPTHVVTNARQRAEMRLALVTAMVVGGTPETDTEVSELISSADRIIAALEARHQAERRGE